MCQFYSVCCSTPVIFPNGHGICEMLAGISTTRYLRGQCSSVSLLELLGLQDCERLDLSHCVTGKLENLMECCSSNIQIW